MLCILSGEKRISTDVGDYLVEKLGGSHARRADHWHVRSTSHYGVIAYVEKLKNSSTDTHPFKVYATDNAGRVDQDRSPIFVYAKGRGGLAEAIGTAFKHSKTVGWPARNSEHVTYGLEVA
jgi:hypothetical protein